MLKTRNVGKVLIWRTLISQLGNTKGQKGDLKPPLVSTRITEFWEGQPHRDYPYPLWKIPFDLGP